MFKIIIITVCTITLVGMGLLVFPIRDNDYLLYKELLASSTPEKNETNLSYSQQQRKGVCKQVWYQDDTPLQLRIDSDESELFFFRQNNKVEVIEQLGKVTCIMQEELFYEDGAPVQRIRYLEAQTASYNYNSHLFVAQDVKLWKYQLPGHALPTITKQLHPLMSATAHSIEFTLKGEKLDFIAHHMKATMNSNERSL